MAYSNGTSERSPSDFGTLEIFLMQSTFAPKSVVISSGTHGNAVPIIKKPPKRMGTAFPCILVVSNERTGTVQ